MSLKTKTITLSSGHRAQVRREVLHSALKRYLEIGARDGEHHRMAERMLQEMDR